MVAYPSTTLPKLASKCAQSTPNAMPPSTAPSYDYIIIGGILPLLGLLTLAGTAGSVLANRLCASLPTQSILVLERGYINDSFSTRAPLLSLAYGRKDTAVVKYDSV